MTVVSIKKEKKHLCRLGFSDGTELLLDSNIVVERCIHEGDALSGDDVGRLKEESDYHRAKQRALWYLDRSAYTEKELYNKLVRAGFGKKTSAKVLARFCELGLTDDRRYARIFCEQCISSNLSRREIYRRLTLKGIPKELADEVLANTEIDETAQIRKIIEKKYRLRLENPENTQKVYAALIRKGFSFSAVREVLKNYSEELMTAQEDFSEEY